MANITITENDLGSVVYDAPVFEDAIVTFSGEDTFAPGTLFGRVAGVAAAGVPVGTGNRAATLAARTGRDLKVGTYTLTFGNVTTGAGPATLADPDGMTETITVAASGAQAFPNLGVTITIAASGTIYDDNDVVTFAVTAGTKYVPFAVAGSNGSQVPSAVLTAELYKASSGDLATRLLIGGKVMKERLIVDADGDADNLTAAHVAMLRDAGIYALTVRDLSVLDNLT